MNAALVEEITKLVIEKLQDSKKNNEKLTESELNDWNRISQSLNGNSLNQSRTNFRDLSAEEISDWKQITVSLTNHSKHGIVKFKSYN